MSASHTQRSTRVGEVHPSIRVLYQNQTSILLSTTNKTHVDSPQVGNRYGNFALATMFPRREFTGEDLDKTLLETLMELELGPSASVVLLPQTGRPNNTVVQSTEGGGFWALLGHILYPLLAVWRFLSGFLFASPPPPAGPQRPNAHARPGSSAASSEEPQRETLRKRPMENRPDGFKKDGKIHRLRTQEDSEDENNTWNGNSTQQM